MNKDDVKVYLKKGGVKGLPYLKAQALFNECYTIRKVVDAVRAVH